MLRLAVEGHGDVVDGGSWRDALAHLLEEVREELLGDVLLGGELAHGFGEVVALVQPERDDLAGLEGDGELEQGLLRLGARGGAAVRASGGGERSRTADACGAGM